VSREERGHHLVANLAVGEAAAGALAVVCLEQQREKIATSAVRPLPPDQLVHAPVQPSAGPDEPARRRKRQPLEQACKGEGEGRESHHRRVEKLTDLPGGAFIFRAEHRLADHAERQLRHFVAKRDRLTG
jgi:hypothetical protein